MCAYFNGFIGFNSPEKRPAGKWLIRFPSRSTWRRLGKLVRESTDRLLSEFKSRSSHSRRERSEMSFMSRAELEEGEGAKADVNSNKTNVCLRGAKACVDVWWIWLNERRSSLRFFVCRNALTEIDSRLFFARESDNSPLAQDERSDSCTLLMTLSCKFSRRRRLVHRSPSLGIRVNELPERSSDWRWSLHPLSNSSLRWDTWFPFTNKLVIRFKLPTALGTWVKRLKLRSIACKLYSKGPLNRLLLRVESLLLESESLLTATLANESPVKSSKTLKSRCRSPIVTRLFNRE